MTSPALSPSEIAHLQTWQGKSEQASDTLSAWPLAALAATLERENLPPDGTLPPLWHWLHFLPHAPQSQLGEDGHPWRGGFLPPVPLPRRMWAGGRLAWQAQNPLQVGQPVQKRSHIAEVRHKSGQSGELIFVQVHHDYHNARGLALHEEHDIVYRQAPAPGAAPPPGQAAAQEMDFSRRITPDAILLFRYSALTFNGHRIHYDHPYATQIEGYAGLIVHGPLIATLLLDALQRHLPDAQVAAFDFRAVRPAFAGNALQVCGKKSGNGVQLWAQDHEGFLLMQATATLS